MIFLKRCAIVPLSSVSPWILCGLILSCFVSYAQPDIDNTIYNYKSPKRLSDVIPVGQIANTQMDSNLVIELTRLILKDSFPNIHSLLISKNNTLVYENYFPGKDERWGWNLGYAKHDADNLHDIRSISKSVVSACIGIAIGHHKIKSIDDPIFDYLPGYAQFRNKKNAQITHLPLPSRDSSIRGISFFTSANWTAISDRCFVIRYPSSKSFCYDCSLVICQYLIIRKLII